MDAAAAPTIMEVAPNRRIVPPDKSLMPSSHPHIDRSPGPPPEVLAEIDAAWGRAQRPLPEGLVLDFESKPRFGRAWGVLRSQDGTLLERIPASEALAIACGDAALLPVPAVAV
jgi:hypothetical protein